ncbi:hypothetical protein Anas_06497 [Armadillidium nasatum]|uniref:Uncharacterized protein n=1 Tax=Armadillidium nasatum TaxID=96803 RepID=A0A5N5THB0_9CRUS|nr:hypothetical protein Anas_06497 [Armadillidium nasatum]
MNKLQIFLNPVLAYHYSSDEDSPSETECLGADRPIKQSSFTGKKDQHKCSKISFNLDDENQHCNVKKSMPKTHIPLSSSKLPSEYSESVSEDFLDFRSLPRSLARESNRKKANVLNKGLQVTQFSGSASSEGRLSMGRASPEMDALDNLLMNRSVQTNLSLNQEGCLSDQEGSETSTFKGAQEEQQDKNEELFNETEELKQALGRFSSTMQHLQHHTAELENRTKQIEYEFKVSKNDIIHLQETTEVIRSEVKKLSDTVNSITKEASKAKKESVLQRQETEKLQKDASETLSQAKKSQKEFEKLKSEYDSKNSKAILCKEAKLEEENRDKKTSDDKRSNKDGTINQKGGYQSFFQRPSSLIYGLTSKACNKSFNNNKKEKEEKNPSIGKADKEEKKKQKEERQNLKNTERKNKQTKKNESQTTYTVESETKSKFKEDKHFEKVDHHYEKRNYPGFSIENLPMMDDHTDSLERKSDRTRSGSPYVSHSAQNFGLEKSLSSPTVLAKFSNSKLSRPQELCILPTTKIQLTNQRLTIHLRIPLLPLPLLLCHSNQAAKLIRGKPELRLKHYSRISLQTCKRQSSGSLYPLQRQNSLGTVPEEGQIPRQASLMSVPENRPIVDQTLPLSPASSMVSFGPSLSPSGDRLDNQRDRYSTRNSMELVTGPVLSGSLMQESQVRDIPPVSEFHINDFPLATSSIKKASTKKISTETLIL